MIWSFCLFRRSYCWIHRSFLDFVDSSSNSSIIFLFHRSYLFDFVDHVFELVDIFVWFRRLFFDFADQRFEVVDVFYDFRPFSRRPKLEEMFEEARQGYFLLYNPFFVSENHRLMISRDCFTILSSDSCKMQTGRFCRLFSIASVDSFAVRESRTCLNKSPQGYVLLYNSMFLAKISA